MEEDENKTRQSIINANKNNNYKENYSPDMNNQH